MSDASQPAASQGCTIWTPLGGNGRQAWGGNCHVFAVPGAPGVPPARIAIDFGYVHAGPNERGHFLAFPDPAQLFARPGEPDPPGGAVQALFLTHGHIDHIGGVAHALALGYRLPRLYGSPLTLKLLEATLAQHGIPVADWPPRVPIGPDTTVAVGPFRVTPSPASHSLPQTTGFLVETDSARILHAGDVKADQTVISGTGTSFPRLAAWGEQGVDALLLDATSAATPGATPLDSAVRAAYGDILRENPGRRVVFGVFSGYLEMIANMAAAAAADGRTVVVEGTELTAHLAAARAAGADLDRIAAAASGGRPVRILEGGSAAARALDPARTVVLATGVGGETWAPLARGVAGTHPSLRITADDTIVLTVGAGPTPELQAELAEDVRRLGARLVTREGRTISQHGHGYQDDLRRILEAVRPSVVLPTHGTAPEFQALADLAGEEGYASLTGRNGEPVAFAHGAPPRRLPAAPERWVAAARTERAAEEGRDRWHYELMAPGEAPAAWLSRSGGNHRPATPPPARARTRRALA